MGAWTVLLRRSRATTRVEKAAGGVTQATWAIEQLAGYFERGGTLGGLQFLIGEEGDSDEIQQTYGEDPGPLPPMPAPCPVGEDPWDGEEWPLIDGFTWDNVRFEACVRYQILNYGTALADDQEELGAYYDNQLPTYLIRISEVRSRPGQRMTQTVLHAIVAERARLE